MATLRYDLAFMEENALDANRVLAASERGALSRVRAGLDTADAVVVHIGGKAGRLGEAIVGTAFLEGTLQTLAYVGKAHTPLTVIIDGALADIMPVMEYRARYWPEIAVIAATPTDVDRAVIVSYARVRARNILALDFHGEHDSMPTLYITTDEASGVHCAMLTSLNRVALRSYAARGPEQRYAAFFRDLFRLLEQSLNGAEAQPRIYLPAADAARFSQLARAFGLDMDATLIVCFFQSVVVAKCHERWDGVMAMIAAQVGQRFPGRLVNFLVACGPDTNQPVHQEDLAAILGGFTGDQRNARVIVATTPSLLDLAVFLRHTTLALANDTGPGHLAGALAIPTITPYLPGTVYSRQVGASTLWHRGVTIDPNPYSFETLKTEVFAGRTAIINTIPPSASPPRQLPISKARYEPASVPEITHCERYEQVTMLEPLEIRIPVVSSLTGSSL